MDVYGGSIMKEWYHTKGFPPPFFSYDSTNEVSWVYKNQLYVRRNLKVVPDFGFTIQL